MHSLTGLCISIWWMWHMNSSELVCTYCLEWIFSIYFFIFNYTEQCKVFVHWYEVINGRRKNKKKITKKKHIAWISLESKWLVSIQLDAIECVVDWIPRTTNYLFIQCDDGQWMKKKNWPRFQRNFSEEIIARNRNGLIACMLA